MKTILIPLALTLAMTVPTAATAADSNIKYSQCLNTFTEKDGIRSGTIVTLATGEVLETLEGCYRNDHDLISPICSLIKDGRRDYLMVSGAGKKILCKRLK